MSKERIILERKFVPQGTVIIKQGDDAFAAYLIQSGRVSVTRLENGKEILLAELGVGEICGEMALINEAARTASVVALEDCNLIIITKAAFEQKLENTDPTIQAIVEMLIERMIQSNKERIDALQSGD